MVIMAGAINTTTGNKRGGESIYGDVSSRGLTSRPLSPSHPRPSSPLFSSAFSDGTGTAFASRWRQDYEDLSFQADDVAKHDRPGLVCMGWMGDKPPGWDPQDKDPNKRMSLAFGSRFTINIGVEPGFNGFLPVIGIVVEGMEVLQQVSETPGDSKHRPENMDGVPIDVVIADCGEVTQELSHASSEQQVVIGPAKPVDVQ